MTSLPLFSSFSALDTLGRVYPVSEHGQAEQRIRSLQGKFEAVYGHAPQYIARAPGRVNVIGEHIDYCGNSVLPMAVAQDVLVAFTAHNNSSSDPGKNRRVRVANVDTASFEPFEFDPIALIDADVRTVSPNRWHWYVLAGYKGALIADADAQSATGADLLFDGRVPMGSGLSSSSAVVCASTLAALHIISSTGVTTREQCADITAACERFVGLQSGGMDQAISFLGELGSAKLIRFAPMGARNVSLPSNAVFVIANSLEVSNKAVTAKQNYNKRVLECRLAATLLASRSGHLFAPKVDTIVRDAVRDVTEGGNSLVTLHDAIVRQFSLPAPPTPCGYLQGRHEPFRRLQSIRGVCGAIAIITGMQISVDEFVAAVLPPNMVTPSECDDVIYNPLDRLLHVISEALRVQLFAGVATYGAGIIDGDIDKVCRIASDGNFEVSPNGASEAIAASPADSNEARVAALGRLMDESQASCRDLYECSCDTLDRLTAVARKAGAAGSRLTGAGWGGCTVSLLDADKTSPEKFIEEVTQQYYLPMRAFTAEELRDFVFRTAACGGGGVMTI